MKITEINDYNMFISEIDISKLREYLKKTRREYSKMSIMTDKFFNSIENLLYDDEDYELFTLLLSVYSILEYNDMLSYIDESMNMIINNIKKDSDMEIIISSNIDILSTNLKKSLTSLYIYLIWSDII